LVKFHNHSAAKTWQLQFSELWHMKERWLPF